MCFPEKNGSKKKRHNRARQSVPQRAYEALERGRGQWQVPETNRPIMEIAPEAYKSKKLHFKANMASEAMQKVVEAAMQDFPAERFHQPQRLQDAE